ncbi:hypothetical protein [Comamonas sp. JUb58]|uniref:hypothetical protein n=1 Tax=Comamonas sp. JUb58 TaxID=2485114 RepID=UPI00105B894D|nr:hypothetical protein [Comamonas sp. JUb58]
MTTLSIVPPREQTPAEKLLSGIKGIKPPPGVLQCAKCGSRTVMTTTTGASIDENGRYKRGIVCDDRICYHCHMRGVWSQMVPDKPRIVKEPKPRRIKPAVVK